MNTTAKETTFSVLDRNLAEKAFDFFPQVASGGLDGLRRVAQVDGLTHEYPRPSQIRLIPAHLVRLAELLLGFGATVHFQLQVSVLSTQTLIAWIKLNRPLKFVKKRIARRRPPPRRCRCS